MLVVADSLAMVCATVAASGGDHRAPPPAHADVFARGPAEASLRLLGKVVSRASSSHWRYLCGEVIYIFREPRREPPQSSKQVEARGERHLITGDAACGENVW